MLTNLLACVLIIMVIYTNGEAVEKALLKLKKSKTLYKFKEDKTTI